jgi:hypothetical protein
MGAPGIRLHQLVVRQPRHHLRQRLLHDRAPRHRLRHRCWSPIYAAHRARRLRRLHRRWGNYVKVDHGGGIVTGYAHIVDGGYNVGYGQWVNAGDVIAYVGNTGAHRLPPPLRGLLAGVRIDPAPVPTRHGISSLTDAEERMPRHPLFVRTLGLRWSWGVALTLRGGLRALVLEALERLGDEALGLFGIPHWSTLTHLPGSRSL